MNNEKINEVFLLAEKLCGQPNQGYQFTCPECGGYAIVVKNLKGAIRIRCTECVVDIYREAV